MKKKRWIIVLIFIIIVALYLFGSYKKRIKQHYALNSWLHENMELLEECIEDEKFLNQCYGAFFNSKLNYGGIHYYLISNGADPNRMSKSYSGSLLSNAAYNIDYAYCKFLIEHGADATFITKNGYTIIDEVFASNKSNDYNKLKTIKFLEENGAQVSENANNFFLSYTSSIIEKTSNYWSAHVFKTSQMNSTKYIVQMLIDKGLDTGLSPISEAAILGKSDEVRAMLNENLSVDEWVQVIDATLAFGELETVKAIENMGYDFSQTDEETKENKEESIFADDVYYATGGINLAAMYGNYDVFVYMYENNMYVNEFNFYRYLGYDKRITEYMLEKGYKPTDIQVRYACDAGDKEMIRILLESLNEDERAEVATQTLSEYYFLTPKDMYNTSQDYKFLDMMEYLMEFGATLDGVEFCPDIKICRWLVEHGKSPEYTKKMQENSNEMPVESVFRSKECLEYLVSLGADVNNPFTGECPALDEAVKHGYVDSVEYLLDNGAYIGECIYYASEGGCRVIRALCEHGANVDMEITVKTIKGDRVTTPYENAVDIWGYFSEQARIMRKYR